MKVWKCFIPKCIFIHPFWTDVLYVVACSCYYHCLVACKNKPTRFSHPPKNKEPLLSHYQLQQIFFLHFLYRFFFFFSFLLMSNSVNTTHTCVMRDAHLFPVKPLAHSHCPLSGSHFPLLWQKHSSAQLGPNLPSGHRSVHTAPCNDRDRVYILYYIFFFYDVWSNLNSNLPSILEGNHRCLCPCRFHHFGRGIVLDISGDMTSHS